MEEVVQELNWLAGCTQQIVWLADLDTGSLLYVSDGFDALWGLRKQDLLADPLRWHDAILADDLHRLPKPFFAETDLTEPLLHVERRYRIAPGNSRPGWVHDRRFIRRDAHGKARSVVGLVERIHPHQASEDSPEGVLRAPGSKAAPDAERGLTALMAHDLRSPLSAMRGWAHILHRSGELTALQTQALQGLERCIATQAQLISAVLDGQLVQSGKFPLSLEEVQVSRLVDQAVQLSLEAARHKQIQLDVRHLAAQERVRVDVERLRQALARLISDAIRATPKDAAVRVSSRLSGQAALLEIADEGVPPAAVEPDLNCHLAEQTIQLHGGQVLHGVLPANRGRVRIVTLPVVLDSLGT